MHDGGNERGGQRVNFFITVDGQKPRPFDPNDPPAIITTQGAVEEWTIEEPGTARCMSSTCTRSTSCWKR